MARMPITIYKKSPLATIISLLGSAMLMIGIVMLFEEPGGAVICLLIAVGLMLWASAINKDKLFKLWIKELKAKGVIDQLATSKELCVQMYNANPNKKTIQFIAKHNPVVAEELSAKLKK